MKRVGNLFALATSPQALHQGYLDARHGKRGCRAVYAFERRIGTELDALHEELQTGAYQPRRYNHFWVYEPKPRQISAPAFRDRVVQHALYSVVRPVFERSFVDTSFACRPGKGTHAAADYVQRAMQAAPRDSYYVQLDVRRYYYSIRHDILRRQIERKVKDARLVDLWMQFADTGDGKTPGVGLPIGCLMSQLNGLIYLDPLDHFIKRDLEVRHYARYVDDFVLIGVSRAEGERYALAVADFLASRLGLSLSRCTIARVTRGINFVGYRTWASRRFVRKHSLYTYRRAIRVRRLESIVSCLGHARRTASLRHMLTTARTDHDLYRQLPQSYRQLYNLRARHAGHPA